MRIPAALPKGSRRQYKGQLWGRSISHDGKICDTLWKRARKAKQAAVPPIPKVDAPVEKASAVPLFVRLAVRKWMMQQGRQ